MNSEATEQRGEGEELRDEGGEMIITNNEESEQRSEAVQELQDESKKTVQAPNNEASERGNEAVEELHDESKTVVQDIHLY